MPAPQPSSARSRLPLRAAVLGGVMALLAAFGATMPVAAQTAQDPIRMRIVGGLASLSQYVDYEEPFWKDRVPQLTHGRVRAEIAPFDRSGIRGQEMLQLMRLGVVPYGYVLLGARGGGGAAAQRARPATDEYRHRGAPPHGRARPPGDRPAAARPVQRRAALDLHLSVAGDVLPAALLRPLRPHGSPDPHLQRRPVGTRRRARRHPGGDPARRDRAGDPRRAWSNARSPARSRATRSACTR